MFIFMFHSMKVEVFVSFFKTCHFSFARHVYFVRWATDMAQNFKSTRKDFLKFSCIIYNTQPQIDQYRQDSQLEWGAMLHFNCWPSRERKAPAGFGTRDLHFVLKWVLPVTLALFIHLLPEYKNKTWTLLIRLL